MGRQEAAVRGIAVLRFHAGVVDGPKGPEDVEHAAVIDLQSSTAVSVEVQKQGDKQAQWTWDDGKLVVASADGVTDEFQLRQGKPKEAPPVVQPKRTAEPGRPQAQDPVRAAVRVLSRSLYCFRVDQRRHYNVRQDVESPFAYSTASCDCQTSAQ